MVTQVRWYPLPKKLGPVVIITHAQSSPEKSSVTGQTGVVTTGTSTNTSNIVPAINGNSSCVVQRNEKKQQIFCNLNLEIFYQGKASKKDWSVLSHNLK
jgi:hypothetical protein